MRLKIPSAEQMLFMANILAGKLFFSARKPEKVKSVLVVKWDEIGDMATATHVFELLKKTYPNSEITILCKPFVKALILSDPYIDHCITNISEWQQTYDIVLEMRGTWSTFFKAFRFRPKCRLSRAEQRWKNRGAQLHEIDTNYEVIKPLLHPNQKKLSPKLYFSEEDKQIVKDFLNQHHINKYCLIHAGARRKLRQWNPDRFAKAADYIQLKYQFKIIFIGSKDESADSEHIISMMGTEAINTCGKFSLSQLSCLCSMAGFYLGNESGPLHIASAFVIPTIALFGPGVPRVFYPEQKNARVLHTVLPCNPCDQIHCVYPANPCISRISLEDVQKKMDEILQS